LATFSWRSKKKYARQQGGTPSQFVDYLPLAGPTKTKIGKSPKIRDFPISLPAGFTAPY
jgi:hypothetical protein